MRRKLIAGIVVVLCFIAAGSYMYIKKEQKSYSADELEINELLSENDADGDGIDDYTDIYEGAIAYIATEPAYKSEYYAGGYPDDGYGVCTDVIWNAFQAAGYDLKTLVDQDITDNISAYTSIETPDPNIDFRRVYNLNTFFERNAESLTTSFEEPEEWQAGDIVVFEKHIAICSEKRNKDGIPFIVHHDSKGAREANDMNQYEMVAHYRWNG